MTEIIYTIIFLRECITKKYDLLCNNSRLMRISKQWIDEDHTFRKSECRLWTMITTRYDKQMVHMTVRTTLSRQLPEHRPTVTGVCITVYIVNSSTSASSFTAFKISFIHDIPPAKPLKAVAAMFL